jgi:hypothetical protein
MVGELSDPSEANFPKSYKRNFLSFLVLLPLTTGAQNKRKRAAKGVLDSGENPALEGGVLAKDEWCILARTRAFLWVASAHGICRERPSLTGPFCGVINYVGLPHAFLAP